MKKVLVIGAVVLSALLLIGLIWGIISLSGMVGPPKETVSLEDYLQENWPSYVSESYDQGVLILSYPISVTYAQAEQFGQKTYGDLVEGHKETLQLIRAGICANCTEQPELLILNGRTTDGKTAYTVTSSGAVETCWQTN